MSNSSSTDSSISHVSISTLAVESNQNTPNQGLRILSGSTDAQGIRRIELQTTATGNDRAGYKMAEREAHSWFFGNYDPLFPKANMTTHTELATATIELGLSSGRITEDWLMSSHPIIETPDGKFMFGHHVGINPTSPNGTWRFQFEIVPTK